MKDINKSTQIEFQWYMHYKCNYRCPYCYFLKDRRELMRKDIYLSVNEWVKHWDRIYERDGSVQIHLTGGEPCIYPSFIELVKELSKKHTFKISTNLSGDFERFSKEIDPAKIPGGIGASFHPASSRFETFLEKVLLLKNRGFFVYITYVAYPPQLKQMPYFIERFKSELEREGGFSKFVILPYRGDYKGVSYPDWYPEGEQDIIWKIAEELGDDGSIKDFKYQLSRKIPLIGLPSKERELPNLGRENPKGKLCRAGQIYAVIDSDGSVTRCGEKGSKYLGTFFDENFKLLDSPLPCEHSSCNCEFKWLVEQDEGDMPEIIVDVSFSKRAPENLPPPHKVYFNWDIHYSCNYRCSYCFFESKWEEVSKGNSYPGIEKWIDVWKGLHEKYGTCRIDISGGEPTTYPSFLKLAIQLSRIHDLRITTNLSFDATEFMRHMTPVIKERGPGAAVINSSFKPDRVCLDDFFEKVLFLKDSGFSINVTYVAYPPHLDRMFKVKKKFEDSNIEFVIQPFRGKYHDQIYPAGYTEEEKRVFGECYNGNPPPLVNYFVEDKINKERKLCRMGQVYAKIYPNGDAYRCCAQGADRLGNLINDRDFSLLEEPDYCDLTCPCWKAMIVGNETNWLTHWVEK